MRLDQLNNHKCQCTKHRRGNKSKIKAIITAGWNMKRMETRRPGEMNIRVRIKERAMEIE